MACGPGGPSGSGDEVEGSGSSGSGSSGSASEGEPTSASSSASSSETDEPDETETTDAMPDTCPVEPALGDYEVLLDGHDYAIDYTEEDEHIIWTHACTVTSHVGTLAKGETIELACTDEKGEAVEHTIELHAVVDGAPSQAPVAVGQQVELALWLRFWFLGTVAWTLRDADNKLLLVYFNGPSLPSPDDDFAPPPEHVAPLTLDVNHEVCPWYCPEEEESIFLPVDECCYRDTALRVDLGHGAAEVQGGSAGSIPGGGHAIVEASSELDLDSCTPVDTTGSYFVFTIVAG